MNNKINEGFNSLPDDTIAFAERIFDAARAGNISLIQSAIEVGLPINLTNSSGNNLLMLASYHGRSDLVNLLLSRGVQPNELNDRGQTALAGAIFKGWDDVVKALIEAGADIRAGKPNAIDSTYMFKRDQYWSILEASIDDISSDVPRRIP